MLVVGSLSVNEMVVNLPVENPVTENRPRIVRSSDSSHDPHEDGSNAVANPIAAAE
jgi:hypothetical protein